MKTTMTESSTCRNIAVRQHTSTNVYTRQASDIYNRPPAFSDPPKTAFETHMLTLACQYHHPHCQLQLHCEAEKKNHFSFRNKSFNTQ